ncbi:histidine kinase [Algoriphagus sp. Y33]|uniref:tetratricopeptide repeat-containing sensor histidine kinase n=1 Tax=Algoriphagus sp. Y33 TaxID=2772483 RepID=UPI0017844090|nr:histidine kinase [Algoriphagus sp. Y33]
MKAGYVFFFLLVTCFSVSGQEFQGSVDSLSMHITSMPERDTATINLRNDYVKQALFANPADSTLTGYARQTAMISEEIGYSKGLLLAYERLGLISQYSLSNPFRALDYYHQALAVVESNRGFDFYKWEILGNIATIYYEQEEYEEALKLFKEVAMHSKASELPAILNMANIFGATGKADSAIFYYQKALKYSGIKENPTQKANLYSNLSLMYTETGRTQDAVTAVEESLSLIEAHGIAFVRPSAYANAAMAYLGAGDYQKAERFAEESLKLSENQGNLFLQKSAWGTLSDVFAATGDYRSGLEAYVKFATLKDSLNNQNRRVEINRKQMAFDFEKERALTQAELNRQTIIKRASMMGGAGVVLVLVGGFILYKRRWDALTQKKEAEFKALVSDTELKALRSQMNPHFIFNSLNSIGDYILKNDNNSAQDYLTKFAKLMRTVLENSEHREIPLSEDLKFIELYLQVETKRLPGKFSYTIHIENGLDAENILVPPLILQPFIENSIWHGFKDKKNQGHISIDFKRKGETLLCSVDDNGTGRSINSSGSTKKSLGVAITENRIRILNKQNDANGRLRIVDKPENTGTRVELSLPLQTAF